MKTASVSEKSTQREGLNPCRIRPQNLASKMPQINCPGLFGCAGGHFSKNRDSFSMASPLASLISCNLPFNTLLFSSFMVSIDGLKKGLSISIKKASQFILAAEAATLLFGGAACANPTGQNIPPTVPTPVEPVPVKPKPDLVPLEAPTGLNLHENVLSWNAVEHATGYVVNNGERDIPASTNFCTLTDEGTYSVKALGDGAKYLDSDFSQESVNYTAKVIDPNEEPDPEKEPANFIAVKDVKFDKVGSGISLINAKKEVKKKIIELQNQAWEIWEQYRDLPETDPANVFRERFILMQSGIIRCLAHDSTSALREAIPHECFVNFFNEFPDWDGKDLFIKQLETFQKANALSTRIRGTDLPQLATELETAWAEAMGDEPMPATAAAAAAMLKPILQDSVPEAAGLPGPNLIQQIEDIAEFHGWTQDWEKVQNRDIDGLQTVVVAGVSHESEKLANFTITQPTDAQIANVMPRKKMDAENGIVV